MHIFRNHFKVPILETLFKIIRYVEWNIFPTSLICFSNIKLWEHYKHVQSSKSSHLNFVSPFFPCHGENFVNLRLSDTQQLHLKLITQMIKLFKYLSFIELKSIFNISEYGLGEWIYLYQCGGPVHYVKTMNRKWSVFVKKKY